MATKHPSTKIYKALMHTSRLEILEILRQGEQCVCHIEATLGYRQSYVSQQLMVLREAGLVEDRRDGARIFYRVIKPEIFTLVEMANKISGAKAIHVKQIQAANCPCPKCNPGDASTNNNIFAEGMQKGKV
jgi:DNA-binding transcriptional ArsR family regulator